MTETLPVGGIAHDLTAEPLIVLLIEDNPAEARLLRELLAEAAGPRYAILHADRLSTGLRVLAGGSVNAVLLDLSLPDGSGLDTFHAVHRRVPDVPIVVLTGLDDEQLALQAMHEGAQDYLTKQSFDGRLLDRSLRYAVQRKRAEAERLVLMREQAARAEAEAALRARDQFLSIASHELKTPVTVMLGYAQAMQRRARRTGNLDERDERSLRGLVAQTKRMSRLISVLLDLSRLQTGTLSIEPRPLDLGTLVQGLLEEMQPTLSRHTFEFTDVDERLIVDGDELRLQEVLYNLLQNAVKYSPDGGAVQVELARRDGWACVSVKDCGIGIPAEAMPQLGTLYYRVEDGAHRLAGGMGIGLFIAKELLAMHGGRLEVESTVGTGSTFRVVLPLRESP